MAHDQTSHQTLTATAIRIVRMLTRALLWARSTYRHRPPYAALLLGSLVLIALHTLSPAIGNALQWQINTLNLQAWWRPFTAHLVHTNLAHLLMNLLGLWLLVCAAYPLLRTRQTITLYLLCCVAIGLTLPASGLGSYRGLSGVLYGVLAWLSVASWRCPGVAILPSWLAGGLLALLLWPDSQHDAFTAHLIQARVAHLAHLSGALCGALYGMLCQLPTQTNAQRN